MSVLVATDGLCSYSSSDAVSCVEQVAKNTIEEAVKAASVRGWEAIVLILVMLALIGLTGVIVRWLIHSMDKRMNESIAREDRMALRLTELEQFNQNTLLKIINDTSSMTTTVLTAVQALTNALEKRPCLLGGEQQYDLVDRIAETLANKSQPYKKGPGK